MKKIILLLLLLPILANAQSSILGIKFGSFSPDATETGFIIGFESAKYIDNRFSVGFSADWFNKNFVDQDLVKRFEDFNGNIGGTVNELRAKTNIHNIPLMGNITGTIPVAKRTKVMITAGAGMDLLLIFFRDYVNPDQDEFKAAVDFSWSIGTGILYEVGRRSDVFLQINYHSSKPSWTYEVFDETLNRKRTFEREFDMSGIMARVGFRFFL